MDENVYDHALACAAQDKYCEEHHLPHFAPYSGVCYRCGRSIYTKYFDLKGKEIFGYSVDYASTTLVTGCPFCSSSYCD